MPTPTTTSPAKKAQQEQFVLPENIEDPTLPSVIDEVCEGLQQPSAFPWDFDSPRIKSTQQIPERLKNLMSGNWPLADDKKPLELSESVAQEACSEHMLERIKNKVGDVDKADNRRLHRLNITRNRLVPLTRELAGFFPQCSIQLSGFFLYPKGGGYMGWHTNSGAACTRIYLTHVPEGDKSFFRYYCGGKYVTSWDKEGWNIRQFEVTEEDKDPLWHCVYSDTQRLSVGFRINKNLKPLK